MDYPLYLNDDKYYIIINNAISYNIGLEIKTSNKIFISNELLSNYLLIEFNEENLNNVLDDLNINRKNPNCNNILFNNKIYKFNNWIDVFNYYTETI